MVSCRLPTGPGLASGRRSSGSGPAFACSRPGGEADRAEVHEMTERT
ncbi:MAG: hypothetical protein ACYDHX_13635 [Methanothrix sp.]